MHASGLPAKPVVLDLSCASCHRSLCFCACVDVGNGGVSCSGLLVWVASLCTVASTLGDRSRSSLTQLVVPSLYDVRDDLGGGVAFFLFYCPCRLFYAFFVTFQRRRVHRLASIPISPLQIHNNNPRVAAPPHLGITHYCGLPCRHNFDFFFVHVTPPLLPTSPVTLLFCLFLFPANIETQLLSKLIIPTTDFPFALRKPERRVSFALNCGSLSISPWVAIYSPPTVEEQIEEMSTLYLQNTVEVSHSSAQRLRTSSEQSSRARTVVACIYGSFSHLTSDGSAEVR